MTALVVGASSGLGRALAYALAERGRPLLLVASEMRDLEALANDLRLRYSVNVITLAMDLAREINPSAQILTALAALPPLQALLLPLGYSRDDDDFSLTADALDELLAINLRSPLTIVHALLPQLLAERGIIVGFGSIAAVRGRGRNVAYSAAKRGLQSLFESLRQRYQDNELRVHFYPLGFMRSNLSFHIALPPLPTVTPETVAHKVVARLETRSGVFYQPTWWRLIALILQWMPWRIFRRLKA